MRVCVCVCVLSCGDRSFVCLSVGLSICFRGPGEPHPIEDNRLCVRLCVSLYVCLLVCVCRSVDVQKVVTDWHTSKKTHRLGTTRTANIRKLFKLEKADDVIRHEVREGDPLASHCEAMCREVGAYPMCTGCPDFIAPDRTPCVMTYLGGVVGAHGQGLRVPYRRWQ